MMHVPLVRTSFGKVITASSMTRSLFRAETTLLRKAANEPCRVNEFAEKRILIHDILTDCRNLYFKAIRKQITKCFELYFSISF